MSPSKSRKDKKRLFAVAIGSMHFWTALHKHYMYIILMQELHCAVVPTTQRQHQHANKAAVTMLSC